MFKGLAIISPFELSTRAWEDDVEDLPLTYRFAYVSGSANQSDISSEVIVRPALETAKSSDVSLPQASTEPFTPVIVLGGMKRQVSHYDVDVASRM